MYKLLLICNLPCFIIRFKLLVFSNFLYGFLIFFRTVHRVRFLCVFRLGGILSSESVFVRSGLFNTNRVIRIFLGHNQSFYGSALYQKSTSWHSMEISEYENIEIFNNTQSFDINKCCLLYTSPSPRDRTRSRMPSSA